MFKTFKKGFFEWCIGTPPELIECLLGAFRINARVTIYYRFGDIVDKFYTGCLIKKGNRLYIAHYRYATLYPITELAIYKVDSGLATIYKKTII